MKRLNIEFISKLLFLMSTSFLIVGGSELYFKINEMKSVYTNENIILINMFCWCIQIILIIFSYCREDCYKMKSTLLTIIFFTTISLLTCYVWSQNGDKSLSKNIMIFYLLSDIFIIIFFGILNFLFFNTNEKESDEDIVEEIIDEDDLDDDFIEEVDF